MRSVMHGLNRLIRFRVAPKPVFLTPRIIAPRIMSAQHIDTKSAAATASAAGISTSASVEAGHKTPDGAFTSKAEAKPTLFNSGVNYAAFRPTYPASLFTEIVEYTTANRNAASGGSAAAGSKKLELCLDIGSGTGQATVELAAYFDRVIGIEGSKSMRDGATKKPNITYVDGLAEALPSSIAANSVDLITVAQALHWFDLPKFWSECSRVLKPGGSVAFWSYALTQLDHAEASKLIEHFHYNVCGPYWDEKRTLVDTNYQSIQLPESHFSNTKRLTRSMGRDMSLTNLLHYIGTSSALKTFKEKEPKKPDPRIELERQLLEVYKQPKESITVKASHVVTLLLGQKPASKV